MPTYRRASMDTELTADLFHGPCGIMRQLYKAFPSLWHHQSHSYPPIWASDTDRVYPHRELGGCCWYVPTYRRASMDTELTGDMIRRLDDSPFVEVERCNEAVKRTVR